jgi:hypothetical protein
LKVALKKSRIPSHEVLVNANQEIDEALAKKDDAGLERTSDGAHLQSRHGVCAMCYVIHPGGRLVNIGEAVNHCGPADWGPGTQLP